MGILVNRTLNPAYSTDAALRLHSSRQHPQVYLFGVVYFVAARGDTAYGGDGIINHWHVGCRLSRL